MVFLLFVLDIGFPKLTIEVFKVTTLQCKLKYVKRMKGQISFPVYLWVYVTCSNLVYVKETCSILFRLLC